MNELRERASQEEMQEKRQAYVDRGLSLVEKWSSNNIGTRKLAELALRSDSSMNNNHVYQEKAINTAYALEKQERYLKKFREDTVSTQFGTRPEGVLMVARIGVANSNLGRMFTEMQLNTTDDAIYYVDATIEQSLRDGTAGQKIFENVTPRYPTETEIENLGTGNGALTTFSATMSVIPLVPYKVILLVGGQPVGSDDGSGSITSSTSGYLTGTNTVDYTTGDVTVTFASAVASGVSVDIEYSFNSELTSLQSNVGTVTFDVYKKRFHAHQDPLGYKISGMSELALETTGLLSSAQGELIRRVGDFHAKARDEKSIREAKRWALGNTIRTFNADFASEGEVSDKSHAQRIWSTIKDVEADVYEDLDRAGSDMKIIAGSKALVYLMKHERFVEDNTQPRSGCYLAGRLNGYEVFTVPASSNTIAVNEILVNFQGFQDGDFSIVYGFLTEMVADLKYPDHNTEGNLAVVWDKMVVEKKYLRLIRIENLTNV